MEMEKKNKLDAQTRKVLSKILISNTEEQSKNILIKKIKSDKGVYKGVYKYLLKKFHNDRVINCLDSQILLSEIGTFKEEAHLKAYVIAKTKKLNLIDVKILEKLEPMEAHQYMRGFLHSSKIGNFITDFSQKELGKEIEKLVWELDNHRNRKGKQWRDKLYPTAYIEYMNNKNTDKTKALKVAFESMPNSEKDKVDFDLHFKSILDKFYKYTP